MSKMSRHYSTKKFGKEKMSKLVKIRFLKDIGDDIKRGEERMCSKTGAEQEVNHGRAKYVNLEKSAINVVSQDVAEFVLKEIETIKIPDRLRSFNFVLIHGKDNLKNPDVPGWQNNIFRFENLELQKHLLEGKNYGVMTGKTSMIEENILCIIDFDKKEFQDEIYSKYPKIFDTFTTSSGSSKECLHLWVSTNEEIFQQIRDEKKKMLVEIRGQTGKQVIGVGSKHKEGTTYHIIKDVDFLFIHTDVLREMFLPYDKTERKTTKIPSTPTGFNNAVAQECINSTPMIEVLKSCGVDINKNPTKCPLHDSAGGKCLSWNEEVLHCFHCQNDDKGWNKFSFIKEVLKLVPKNIFEWFAGKAGRLEELKLERKKYVEEKAENILETKIGEEEIKKIELTPEQLEISKDKNFYKNILNSLDEILVGERSLKKILILCAFGGRLVKNSNRASFGILVNDESGVGKDFGCKKILKMLSKKIFYSRTRISPKALDYWTQDWNGKVLLLSDIEEDVLNSSTLKTFMSDDTAISIVEKQKIVHKETVGKPILVLTTAESIPITENLRRLISVKLDNSKEQTQAIAQYQLDEALGIENKYDIQLSETLSLLESVIVIFTPEIINKIKITYKVDDISDRTQHLRYIDFIKASAALHQYSRKKDDKNRVIAEIEDFEIANSIFEIVAPEEIKRKTATTAQQKILKFFLENPNFVGHKLNILTCLQSSKNRLSQGSVYENIPKLRDLGFLDVFESEQQGKDIEFYKLAERWKKDTEGLKKWL